MATETLTLEQVPAWARHEAAKLATLNLTPVWKQVRLLLIAATKENFVGQHTPDRTPWVPFRRTPSRRRGGPGSKLLRDKGLLMASVTASGGGHLEEQTPQRFVFGTNLHYAGYHQFGTRRIPRRQFLGLGQKLLQDIDEAIGEFVEKKLAGR